MVTRLMCRELWPARNNRLLRQLQASVSGFDLGCATAAVVARWWCVAVLDFVVGAVGVTTPAGAEVAAGGALPAAGALSPPEGTIGVRERVPREGGNAGAEIASIVSATTMQPRHPHPSKATIAPSSSAPSLFILTRAAYDASVTSQGGV